MIRAAGLAMKHNISFVYVRWNTHWLSGKQFLYMFYLLVSIICVFSLFYLFINIIIIILYVFYYYGGEGCLQMCRIFCKDFKIPTQENKQNEYGRDPLRRQTVCAFYNLWPWTRKLI